SGVKLSIPPRRIQPVGLIWNSVNYSCAYDATFTILSNVWLEDVNKWTTYFAYRCWLLLQSAVEGRISLEDARNSGRRSMNRARPEYFPYGPNMSSIDRVAEVILPSKSYAAGRHTCHSCGYIEERSRVVYVCWIEYDTNLP
ncbi:hypothetical protein B0H19DRAFT_1348746, partial [Mycena capillaripes]